MTNVNFFFKEGHKSRSRSEVNFFIWVGSPCHKEPTVHAKYKGSTSNSSKVMFNLKSCPTNKPKNPQTDRAKTICPRSDTGDIKIHRRQKSIRNYPACKELTYKLLGPMKEKFQLFPTNIMKFNSCLWTYSEETTHFLSQNNERDCRAAPDPISALKIYLNALNAKQFLK